MPVRRAVLLVLLALAGVVVAAGITTAVTSLTSQRVGLQAEPLDAGDVLAPAPRTTPRPPTARPQQTTSGAAPRTPPPPDEAAEEEEDDGSGRGRGRGRGRGGDDD